MNQLNPYDFTLYYHDNDEGTRRAVAMLQDAGAFIRYACSCDESVYPTVANTLGGGVYRGLTEIERLCQNIKKWKEEDRLAVNQRPR